MRATALQPPPPTPTTLMRVPRLVSSSITYFKSSMSESISPIVSPSSAGVRDWAREGAALRAVLLEKARREAPHHPSALRPCPLVYFIILPSQPTASFCRSACFFNFPEYIASPAAVHHSGSRKLSGQSRIPIASPNRDWHCSSFSAISARSGSFAPPPVRNTPPRSAPSIPTRANSERSRTNRSAARDSRIVWMFFLRASLGSRPAGVGSSTHMFSGHPPEFEHP